MALTKCPDCFHTVSELAGACPECGRPMRQRATRSAAAALAILLGGIGAHRFYVGQPLLGLLYLLFCWSLIPAFIGLCEGIWIASMSDESFVKYYLRK